MMINMINECILCMHACQDEMVLTLQNIVIFFKNDRRLTMAKDSNYTIVGNF